MKKKLICLFIIFAMLFSNSSVFAVGLEKQAVTQAEQAVLTTAEVVAEDVSKRSEYEKHYLRSDGTYVAVSYNDAIHYKDENGDWQDVDNQLSLDTKDGKYKNGTPSFRTEFRSPASNGSLAKISSDGGDITWSLSVNTTLSTVKNAITSKNIEDVPVSAVLKNAEADNTEKFALTKVQGGIEYRNVFANAPEVTVNYSVYHNRVEEDLYFNSQTNVTDIKMEMHLGDLSASVNSDGSVSIKDESGNLKYRIGIPYMQDASDNVLYDIEVRASQNGEYCTITYTPNKAWLTSSERTYPILFDPSITTSEYNSNVQDTYVRQGSTQNYSDDYSLFIGIHQNAVCRAYIQFGKLPEIDPTMPIISASLTFTMHSSTTTGKTTGLYKVAGAWDQNTITYQNQPSSSELVGTSAYNASTNKHIFDVTDNIADIYAGFDTTFNGYMLSYLDESFSNPDYNEPFSSNHGTRSYRPALKIVYGYSIPDGIELNKEYMFESVWNYTYLTVHNGADANDVNVYATGSNNTSSQKFKFVQAANGGYYIRAVCSANNRVLDIYKNDETGYVQDGCNVQIYNPTDPIAQEWFIVALSSETFKIIPRTDMSLALTANSGSGTAEGKDATSPGNVYVSTYDGNGQEWRIIDAATNIAVSVSYRTIPNGVFCINNQDSGKYLWRVSTSSNIMGQSGTLTDLGYSVMWVVEYVRDGGYIIYPYSDPTMYLGISSTVLCLYELNSESIPDAYLWKFESRGGGAFLIRNCGTGQYIYYDSAPLLSNSLPSSSNENYTKYVWRCAIYSTVVNRELKENAIVSLQDINIGDTTSISISNLGTNPIWASVTDFSYTTTNTNVSVSNQGIISGQFEGSTTVIATHKVTNFSYTLSMTVYEGKHYLYVYTSPRSLDNAVAGSIMGHSWVVVENQTCTAVNVGAYQLYPGEIVFIGRWKSDTYEGVWYNKEAYAIRISNKYDDCYYAVTEASESELLAVDSFIDSNCDGYSLTTNNCVHFAVDVWNLCAPSSEHISNFDFTPNMLKNAIDDFDQYYTQTSESIYDSVNTYGYYDNDNCMYISYSISS